jgi:hypothetical protein
MVSEHGLSGALEASGPFVPYRSELDLFGRFVGSWDVEGRFFDEQGAAVDEHRGEWHFGWVLEGRAIQDVLVRPARATRAAGQESAEYGTTLRVFDPSIAGWRVVWIAAVSGRVVSLVGRDHHGEIRIEGRGPDESLYRWTFSEISDERFLWQGFQSENEGQSWVLGQEMIVRRRS